MTQKSAKQIHLILLMILAMMTWGLAWTNGKILGNYTHPTVLILVRFVFTSLIFAPVVRLLKQPLTLPRAAWRYVFLSGLFIALYNLFFFIGTHRGLAGAGGVVVTTLNPVVTFWLTVFFFERTVYRKDYLALVLGLFGGGLIMNIWTLGLDQLFQGGNIYFILCSVTWASLTIVTAKARAHVPSLSFSLYTYIAAALLILPFAWSHHPLEVFTFDGIFWLNLFSISAGAMAFGTTVYFIATRELGSDRSSAFIFTVPVSALFFSAWILKEPITWTLIVGGLLAIAAVYLINVRKKK